MKKTKIIYIGHLTPQQEGGMSRNRAFANYFDSIGAKVINAYSDNLIIRFIKWLQVLATLLFTRNKTLFLHQGTFFLLFPNQLLSSKTISQCIFKLLRVAAKKNHFYFEINDLPYEQTIDLKGNIDRFYLHYQEHIFSIKNLRFIFPSYSLEEYAKKQYNIDKSAQTQTLINGGPTFDSTADISAQLLKLDSLDKSKLKYIYAGTMARGRGVEVLLEIFSKVDAYLILIGTEGQWINSVLPNNILYLGAFEESKALKLASCCDVGLIPYDASKFYYNACYPTKNSFYLSAGLPVLATPLTETMNIFAEKRMFLFRDIKDWKEAIESLNTEEINSFKKTVLENMKNYQWPIILSRMKLS